MGSFSKINPDTQEETLICSPDSIFLILPLCLNLIRRPNVPFIIDLDDDNSMELMSMILTVLFYKL